MLLPVLHALENLVTAHALEEVLSPADLCALSDAFERRGGGLPRDVFLALVLPYADRVAPLDGQPRCTPDAVERWFESLDADGDLRVAWGDVLRALEHAAALRRRPPNYAGEPVITRSQVPGVEHAHLVPQWERLVVSSAASPSVTLCGTTGHPHAHFRGHTAAPLALHFAPSLGRLFTSACDRTVVAWDARRCVPGAQVLLSTPASCLHYEPQAGRLFCALLDGTLQSLHPCLAEPAVVSAERHQDWVTAMASIGDLRLVLTASRDHSVGMWAWDGLVLQRRLTATSRPVWALQYAPASRSLFTCGGSPEIHVWDPYALEGTPSHTLAGSHDRDVAALYADAVAPMLVSVDGASGVTVWSTLTLSALRYVPPRDTVQRLGHLRTSVWNPVTRELTLWMGPAHTVRIPTTAAELECVELGAVVVGLLYHDPVHIVVAVTERVVFVFSAKDGRLARRIDAPVGQRGKVAWAQLTRGLLFLGSSDAGRLHVYDLEAVRTARDTTRLLVPSGMPPVVAVHAPSATLLTLVAFDGAMCTVRLESRRLKDADLQRVTSLAPPAPSQLGLVPGDSPSLLSSAFGERDAVLLFDRSRTVALTTLRTLTRNCVLLEGRCASAPRQVLIHEERSALVVLHDDGVGMYALGNDVLVCVAEITQCCRVLPPLAALSHVRGDLFLARLVDGAGEVGLLSLASVYSKFSLSFSTAEKVAATRAAEAAPKRIKGTAFVILEQHRGRGLRTTLFRAHDADCDCEAFVKVHDTAAAHAADVELRRALGPELDRYVVPIRVAWDFAVQGPGARRLSLDEAQAAAKSARRRSEQSAGAEADLPRGIAMDAAQAQLRGTIDGAGPEWTPALREQAVLDLLRGVAALGRAGYAVKDMRPRNIVRLEGGWCFSSLDTIAPIGVPVDGTVAPAYCAPENVDRLLLLPNAEPRVTVAAAVWALGCVAAEIFTGTALFRGVSDEAVLREVRAGRSAVLSQLHTMRSSVVGAIIADGALEPDPSQRLSPEALLEACDRALAAQSRVRLRSAGWRLRRRSSVADATVDDPAVCGNDTLAAFYANATAGDRPVLPRAQGTTSRALKLSYIAAPASTATLERLQHAAMGRVVGVAANTFAGLVMCADVREDGGGAVHLFDLQEQRPRGLLPAPEVGREDPADRWAPPDRLSEVAKRRMLVIPEAEATSSVTLGKAVRDSQPPATSIVSVARLLSEDDDDDRGMLAAWQKLSTAQVERMVRDRDKKPDVAELDSAVAFEQDLRRRTQFYSDTGGKRPPGEDIERYAEPPPARMNPLDMAALQCDREESNRRRRAARVRRILDDACRDVPLQTAGDRPFQRWSDDFLRDVPQLRSEVDTASVLPRHSALARRLQRETDRHFVGRGGDPVLLPPPSKRNVYNRQQRADPRFDRSLEATLSPRASPYRERQTVLKRRTPPRASRYQL